MHPYQQLIATYPLVLAESSSSYSFITERHIQAMWMEQKFFKSLTSSSGEAITVISPGLWNQGPGPDFLKAHLLINGQDLKGDVEIHLSAEDWTYHGHHQNESYNKVILHVFLWKTKLLNSIQNVHHKPIIQVCLETHLTIPHAKIVNLIDLELYPYRKFVGSGRCAKMLFSRLSEEKMSTLLKTAADWRLIQKRKDLVAQIDDSSSPLTGGMAMALGYPQNKETFLKLFLWLKEFQSLEENGLIALAMGACGFFQSIYQEKWGHSSHYAYLKALYLMLALNIHPIPHFKLHLSQIRPLHHPIRRIVYLAKIIGDTSLSALFPKMADYWLQQWRKGVWKGMKNKLRDGLPSYADPYWNHRYLFEDKPSGQPLPLIGKPLKEEILLNTCLPLLHEQVLERGDYAEIQAFQAFYAYFPAAKTSKTKYLTHRFFGDGPKQELLNKARNAQGAYQLHKDFCIHYEASCVGCPFVDRYNQFF